MQKIFKHLKKGKQFFILKKIIIVKEIKKIIIIIT